MTPLDISWLRLSSAYLLMAIPFGILIYYQTGLLRQTIIALGRMTGQLFFIGLYLQYLFRENNPWLNLFWVFIMTILAVATVIKRSELRLAYFLLPVFLALAASLLMTNGLLLAVILPLENPLQAHYLIPINGMILGNAMNMLVIGMRSFYKQIRLREDEYLYYLSMGIETRLALFPFMREAFQNAYSPALGQMANMGLVSLPGMMTGQILGGSDPDLAIRYQVMILLAIHSTAVVALFLSLMLSRHLSLNRFGLLKQQIVN